MTFRQADRLPSIDLAATGRRITYLRRSAGLSVRDLQAVYGFSTPQAIYKWQRGEALPTLDNIAVLSRILHVSIEEIIRFEEEVITYDQQNRSAGAQAALDA